MDYFTFPPLFCKAFLLVCVGFCEFRLFCSCCITTRAAEESAPLLLACVILGRFRTDAVQHSQSESAPALLACVILGRFRVDAAQHSQWGICACTARMRHPRQVSSRRSETLLVRPALRCAKLADCRRRFPALQCADPADCRRRFPAVLCADLADCRCRFPAIQCADPADCRLSTKNHTALLQCGFPFRLCTCSARANFRMNRLLN